MAPQLCKASQVRATAAGQWPEGCAVQQRLEGVEVVVPQNLSQVAGRVGVGAAAAGQHVAAAGARLPHQVAAAPGNRQKVGNFGITMTTRAGTR